MDAITDIDSERDAIFALLTVAAVSATWDPSPLGEGRGHNIGAVLVDKSYRPVAFARNESSGSKDLTEHAELRLIRSYIAGSPKRTELHKHSVYTTLEPCVMCAGMMLMTNVRRAVHALPDPIFGGVFARLEANPHPYPKTLQHTAAPGDLLSPLRKAFNISDAEEAIHWLPTDSARQAFAESAELFNSYEPVFDPNQRHLDEARQFLRELTR